MGKWKHILSDLNSENNTGVCGHCGPVSVKPYRGKLKCAIAIKEQHQSGDSVQPHGLKIKEAAQFRLGKHCEICGRKDSLVVDHCHGSNIIRGVLCRKCNLAIGYFEDNQNNLKNAIEYLSRQRD